jgi:hypothetical protein
MPMRPDMTALGRGNLGVAYGVGGSGEGGAGIYCRIAGGHVIDRLQ